MARFYGSSGIPFYWIINLIDRQLEVHADPISGPYPPSTIFGGSMSAGLALGNHQIGPIAVAELPPQRAGAKYAFDRTSVACRLRTS